MLCFWLDKMVDNDMDVFRRLMQAQSPYLSQLYLNCQPSKTNWLQENNSGKKVSETAQTLNETRLFFLARLLLPDKLKKAHCPWQTVACKGFLSRPLGTRPTPCIVHKHGPQTVSHSHICFVVTKG